MKRSIILAVLFLAGIDVAYAYIDPGTGGYLASSIFSTVVTFLAVAGSFIIAFFSRRLIKPAKRFFSSHKKISIAFIILIVVAATITAYMISQKKPEFDESLSGAHVYSIDRSYQGYNLYEGKLIDMYGNLVKEWDSIYLGVIDTNGDYYAQQYYESPVWGRYSWDGSVIWEMNLPIHHEIVLTPDDTIITFTKETHLYNERKVEFDVILELDKNGTIIDKWSTWDNLEYLKQFHKPLELDQPPTFFLPEDHKKNMSIWGGEYDYYHLNSISLVPNNSLQGVHPAFNPGNWIIAFRHGSMIFILDKDTKNVLWRAIDDQIEGKLEGPHTPFMTSEGNIIVLDNGRYREYSRIISINPITMDVTWEYKAENPEDFYSLSQGAVQLLPNYNLLVTEAEKGRVFELTPGKSIVWEFYHPEKQNEKNSNAKEKYGQRQEIYRMTRYDKGFIDSRMK